MLSPRLTPARKLAFDFQSKSGKNYLVQYRAALGTGTWLTLQTLPGTGSLITVTDLDPVAGTRFYQVVEQ